MIFPLTLRRLIIALNGCEGPRYFQAGDGVMKPGHVVMKDDADEVKRCTAAGLPIGIVGCDADHDLMTVYAIGERIPIWMIGSGVCLYVAMHDSATITAEWGDIVDSADLTTYTGCAKVKDDAVAVTTVVGANGAIRNITSIFWIGRVMGDGAVSTAALRYVPVLI